MAESQVTRKKTFVQATSLFQGLCTSKLTSLDISFNQLTSMDSHLLARALLKIEQVCKEVESSPKNSAAGESRENLLVCDSA